MKISELKIIYWALGFFLIINVLAIFGAEKDAERYGYIIGAVILLTILLGIKERSDLVRKLAVYYFGFVIFANVILTLIVAPYIIFLTEESVDIFGLIAQVITIAISFYIIRALVNEPLLSEFTPNKSLNQTGANNAPPG